MPSSLPRLANPFERGAGRGQRNRGALQVRDGFFARARVRRENRAEDQVRLRIRGIQAQRGARVGNSFLIAMQTVLRIGEIAG